MNQLTMGQRILNLLRVYPNLTSTEIMTVLETDKRSSVTSVLHSLFESAQILRIKRPNEKNRSAFAYSLAPASSVKAEPRSKPQPKPEFRPSINHDPVVDVVVQQAETLVPSTDSILAHISKMSVADAIRLRRALNEVFA